MTGTEKTVKCPICGRPYVFYAFSAADQSACPKCRAEARANTSATSNAPAFFPETP